MSHDELSCDNPYATMLEAGKLLAQSDAIERRAEAMQSLAMAELEQRGYRPDAPHTPSRVMCFAFGGAADGQVRRLFGEPPTAVKFAPANMVRVDGERFDLATQTEHEYNPVVVLGGDHGLAALMAPTEDGGPGRTLELLSNEDAGATHALVRVLIEGASLNARGVYLLVSRVRNAIGDMLAAGDAQMVFIGIK